MEYCKTVTLRNGAACVLRNGVTKDGASMLAHFILTRKQTDYLLSYPDEVDKTAEEEGEFLQAKTDSPDEIEILAETDGKIVGSAGIWRVGTKEKVRRRAEFGIGVDKNYWGLGIGRALTEACIECARNAGYAQLELDVVTDNERAAALYRSVGFVEYGRNPKGFHSRLTGWQPLALMRLELDESR